MSSFVQLERSLWAHGYDLSAQMIEAATKRGRRSKAADGWGNSTRITAPGVLFGEISGRGLTKFGAGEVEAVLESLFGVQGKNYSMAFEDGAVGDYGISVKGLQNAWNPFATVESEEFTGFAFAVAGQDHFIGRILTNSVISATADSQEYQLGSLTAANNEGVYICVHVGPLTSTPTFDIILESAPTDAFSSPTTRITIPQITSGNTSVFMKLFPSSDISDTYWRAGITVGSSGSAPLFIMAGKEEFGKQ